MAKNLTLVVAAPKRLGALPAVIIIINHLTLKELKNDEAKENTQQTIKILPILIIIQNCFVGTPASCPPIGPLHYWDAGVLSAVYGLQVGWQTSVDPC